jgi:hypothetical protein
VPIRYTQGDVVILKNGAEATGVAIGTQIHDPEWNPAPLDPLPWILNSPMEPSANVPVSVQPRLRSAPPPEPRPDPAPNIMPEGPSPHELNGPLSAGGEGESIEFLRRVGAMESGHWEEVRRTHTPTMG